MVRVSLFYIFGSIEDSWIPITVPAFNILQQIVLFEIYEKNLASCRYEMGKERSILIFLDNWVIVFWQYIKILQVSCSVESDAAFLYCFALNSLGLFCILYSSFFHVWFCDIQHCLFENYYLTKLCGIWKCLHILYNI